MYEYPNPISKGTGIMNKLYIYALRWVCVGYVCTSMCEYVKLYLR